MSKNRNVMYKGIECTLFENNLAEDSELCVRIIHSKDQNALITDYSFGLYRAKKTQDISLCVLFFITLLPSRSNLFRSTSICRS